MFEGERAVIYHMTQRGKDPSCAPAHSSQKSNDVSQERGRKDDKSLGDDNTPNRLRQINSKNSS